MIEQTVGLLRRRILGAFIYSARGLKASFVHEEAFRVEIFLAAFLLPLGLWLGETPAERALLSGSIMVVLIVELLNSAIESAIDRIGTEIAELSGRAKDQGSAAVMLANFTVVAVWSLVLMPRYL